MTLKRYFLIAATVGVAELLGLGLSLVSPRLTLQPAVGGPSMEETAEESIAEWVAAGMVIQPSPYSVDETADRFEAILNERGVTVFARVDHAAGAESVELALRPTQLIIFGNPRVGTPLMQCDQRIAIDLPQKMLIWEDDAGQVYLGYNDPNYLAERHGLTGCDEAIAQVSRVLAGLSGAAIGE